MRVEDVCLDFDIEPLPKPVESIRARLKRLVTHEVVASIMVDTIRPDDAGRAPAGSETSGRSGWR